MNRVNRTSVRTVPPFPSIGGSQSRLRRLAASVAIGVLTACGGSSDPVAGSFNEADVEFAQGMIPHHEQAIEMADIALDPSLGASDAVKALATQIKGAQDPEVDLMTTWLTAWGKPIAMDTSDGHDMQEMEGMLSVDELDQLGQMSGAAFDMQWAAFMIEHHEGAISMAEAVTANGSNAEVAALAKEIIAAQQAEITALQPLAAG